TNAKNSIVPSWKASTKASSLPIARAESFEDPSMRNTGEPQFTCPCCGECFEKFQPHKGRENAKCPKCKSRERHRFLWLYLKHKTNLFHDRLRVLHFAPERWFQALGSLHNLEYLSVDLVPGRAMVAADITQLPLRDNSFDVII